MYDFKYHSPTSVEQAVKALGEADDGTFLAGGQTLIPTLKQRLAAPSQVIGLSRIPGLTDIVVGDGVVSIGAMATHAAVAGATDIRNAIPALADLAGQIGDPHVRNRGTIGGSVANNDPAADYPAAVLGLGATVHTDRRTIAADAFFLGLFETALAPDEMIVRITFPVPNIAAYMKFPHPASGYALVGVMVARTAAGVSVAVTGAGDCVFRVPAMERALSNAFTADSLSGVDIPVTGLNSDLHASAEYRAHLIGVMARRAVAGALQSHNMGQG